MPTLERYRTTDIDAAHDYLCASYLDLQVRSADVGARGFCMRSLVAPMGVTAVTRGYYSASATMRALPSDHPVIGVVRGGRFAVSDRMLGYQVRPGQVFMTCPDRQVELELSDLDTAGVVLPWALLAEVAETMAPLPAGGLRFLSARPASAALERTWIEADAYVRGLLLGESGEALAPLVSGHLERLLAALALSVFPNTTMQAHREAPHDAAPATIRRAVAYLDEHAGESLTLAMIGQAAGMGPRGLQQAFRRHLGVTPMEYLRRARLGRAHADLQAADPTRGETVAGVAARWGFVNPGRFAHHYRQAYGRSPSHTLRS